MEKCVKQAREKEKLGTILSILQKLMWKKFPFVVQCKMRCKQNMQINILWKMSTLLEAFLIMTPSLFGAGPPKTFSLLHLLFFLRFCNLFSSNYTYQLSLTYEHKKKC